MSILKQLTDAGRVFDFGLLDLDWFFQKIYEVRRARENIENGIRVTTVDALVSTPVRSYLGFAIQWQLARRYGRGAVWMKTGTPGLPMNGGIFGVDVFEMPEISCEVALISKEDWAVPPDQIWVISFNDFDLFGDCQLKHPEHHFIVRGFCGVIQNSPNT